MTACAMWPWKVSYSMTGLLCLAYVAGKFIFPCRDDVECSYSIVQYVEYISFHE